MPGENIGKNITAYNPGMYYKENYKISIISFTKYGAQLSLEIKEIFRNINNNSYYKYTCSVTAYSGKKGFSSQYIKNISCPLTEWTKIHFNTDDIIIFIGACGIAVRSIAPYLQSKCTDPAVIVIDDMGTNVISLLSGHLGKANEWTRLIAGALNANPVITTSSDIHNKIPIDVFAAKNNFYIDNMYTAKETEAALLEGKPAVIFSDVPVKGKIPENLYMYNFTGNTAETRDIKYFIVISPFLEYKNMEFYTNENKILHIIPKVITLGIGCRKSKTYDEINDFIKKTMETAGISEHAVSDIATIDLKKNEKGILEYAEAASVPLKFYSAEELNKIEGNFTGSDFVKSITGTDNVCERAALAQGGRELVLKKQAGNGITVAAAIKKWSVNFE